MLRVFSVVWFALNPQAFRHQLAPPSYRGGVRLCAQGEGESSRVLEICRLDTFGDIIECDVVSAEELTELVSADEACRILNSPDDLVFAVEGLTADSGEAGGGKEPTFLTIADWKACLTEDNCQVPKDVMLRVYGPDAERQRKLREEQRASAALAGSGRLEEGDDDDDDDDDDNDGGDEGEEERGGKKAGAGAAPPYRERAANEDTTALVEPNEKPRFHVHFGAGRLGMGLVVPAISASGVPFAVVQRPKKKWQQIFRSEDPDGKLEFTIDGDVVVQDVEVRSSIGPAHLHTKAAFFVVPYSHNTTVAASPAGHCDQGGHPRIHAASFLGFW